MVIGHNNRSESGQFQLVNDSADQLVEVRLSVFGSFVIFIYGALVILGLTGNSFVVFALFRVFRSGGVTYVYVYIFALSVIDTLFLLFQVVTIACMMLKSWIFGDFLCKLTFYYDAMHKTAAIQILVGLTAERFRVICCPSVRSQSRAVRNALKYLCLLLGIAALMNIPFFHYSRTLEVGMAPFGEPMRLCNLQFPMIHHSLENILNSTSNLNISTNSFENLDSPWNHTETYVIVTMFVMLYLIPGWLIAFFTFRMFMSLKKRSRRLRRCFTQWQRVIRIIFAVFVLYLVCWTPFWALQLFLIFSEIAVDNSLYVETIAMTIYLLPLANASLNSFLFGFLNKNLREAFRLATVAKNRQNLGKISEARRLLSLFKRSTTHSATVLL